MMEELARLKEDSSKANKPTKDSFQTPPPKIPGPTPNAKVASSASSASQPPASANAQGAVTAAPSSEGARLARLRRMCEIKPSGKCHVPPEVHERWKKANHEQRLKLADELEAANWAKDCYI